LPQKVKIIDRFSRKLLKNNLNVGLGEIAIGESDICLRVPMLGSCIALVIYIQNQPVESRIAMMAHVMYPNSTFSVNPSQEVIGEGKYADIALLAMIEKLENRGFNKLHMMAKMAGGVINPSMKYPLMHTNEPAIIELLNREKISLKASYTGGTEGLEAVFKIKEYKLYVTPKKAQTMIL